MQRSSDNEMQDLTRAVHEFFQHATTRPEDRGILWRALEARPAFEPVSDLLPADKAAQRLEFARSIEAQRIAAATEKESPLRLNAFALSVICVMPLHTLREEAQATRAGQYSLQSFLSNTETLVRVFMLMTLTEAPPAMPERRLSRNSAEANKCLERDRMECILLGTSGPDACHIFPFAATSSQARADKLAGLRDVAISIMGDRAYLATGDRPGITDKAWNMLCLNPQLHRWWGEARFGLKCLGVTPTPAGGATVSIQFVWMPQQQTPPRGQSKKWTRIDAWRLPVCMDTGEGEEWVAEWRERERYGTAPRSGSNAVNAPGADVLNTPDSHGGIVAAVDARTGRPLRSGSVFYVSLSVLDDAYDMKAMLDLQWACINIACMSAAAGSADFLAADDYDDTFSEGLVAAGISAGFWTSAGPLGE